MHLDDVVTVLSYVFRDRHTNTAFGIDSACRQPTTYSLHQIWDQLLDDYHS